MLTQPEYNLKAHSYLRAESFCAELMEGGVLYEEVSMLLQSNFKKSFRNEIEEVTVKTDDKSGSSFIEMKVNRDGLYDRLPEGLFHQTKGSSRTASTQQMTGEYRQYREEEKQARKFFQPLEQEFFRYTSRIEQHEYQWLFNRLNGRLNNELYDFWNLHKELPTECLERLVSVMPWALTIKCNLKLTALALQVVLDKPVSYNERIIEQHKAVGNTAGLGNMQLGENMVSGNSFSEPAVCWKFSISNVSNEDLNLYQGTNSYSKLLIQFEEIFIPLTIDVIFELTDIKKEDSKTGDRLGVSFIL